MYTLYTMARSSAPKLDRDRVLTAAVALADEVGLESMTMRRLADALGVTPMALYKYFRNRDALVSGMIDAIITRVLASPELASSSPDLGTLATASWRDRAASQIFACRVAVLSHTWLQEAIAGQTLATPASLAYMDRLIGIMLGGGLPVDTVHHVMHALSTRMWGFTLEVFPTPELPKEKSEREEALRAYQTDYPRIVAMTTAIGVQGGCDADAEFRFAIDAIFDRAEASLTDKLHSDRRR